MLDEDLGSFAIKVLDPELPFKASDRLVLIALAKFASSTGVCYPAVGTLAKMTGLDDSTVRRAIRRLEQQGYLTVTGQRESYKTKTYVLTQSLLVRGSSASNQHETSADHGEVTPKVAKTTLPNPTHALPRSRIVPPPPGKTPAEYTYRIRTDDGDYVEVFEDKPHPHTSTSDSEGEVPGGPPKRISLDRADFDREWRTLVMRFSYFLADQLIDRSYKDPRYRDDAASEAWLQETEYYLFNCSPAGSASAREVQAAIESVLDRSDEQTVWRPRDLSIEDLSRAIGEIRKERREATRSGPLMDRKVEEIVAAERNPDFVGQSSERAADDVCGLTKPNRGLEVNESEIYGPSGRIPPSG